MQFRALIAPSGRPVSVSAVAPGRTPLGKPGVTRLVAAKARGPLPHNRWTLCAADTLAAAGYWVGFLATLGADVLRDIARALRIRVTRAHWK